MSTQLKENADYGLDAPTAVRNFILIGSCLTITGVLIRQKVFNLPISFLDFSSFIWAGLFLSLSGVWMIVGSRVLKFRARDKLILSLNLRGDENTLDVGCGRGLLLIGTAKKLNLGKATGVDIWQTVDQSGNDPKVTLKNAELEGVSSKIEIVTGDARKLPFPNEKFHLLTSSWAIHNIPLHSERDQALSEMIRVLKPGGRMALIDIQYFYQYKRFFVKRSDVTFQMKGPDFTFLTPSFLFLVQKR
jgi:arsenite methyltransferase